jgi:hypothetical protein
MAKKVVTATKISQRASDSSVTIRLGFPVGLSLLGSLV